MIRAFTIKPEAAPEGVDVHVLIQHHDQPVPSQAHCEDFSVESQRYGHLLGDVVPNQHLLCGVFGVGGIRNQRQVITTIQHLYPAKPT